MQILGPPNLVKSNSGDVTLPLETPSGYDLSMAVVEDVSCGKDRTAVKTYGTWRSSGV